MNSSALASFAASMISSLVARRAAEGDVFGDRAAEEDRFLQDVADLVAQGFEFVVGDVLAVDPDCAGLHVVEPGDEAYDGGLAGTGRANDADELSGLNFETDVGEYGRGGIVSEGNVFEFDVASERFGFERIGLLGGDSVGVEDCANALRANGSLRDGVGGSGEIFDRLEELGEVCKVDGELAHRHRVSEDKSRPTPKDDGGTERRR